MSPRALIIGVSGQDGALLSRLLLGKGYEVHGSSRDAQASDFANLARVGVRERVTTHSAVPTDFRSIAQLMERIAPDETYLLAGQSSVGLSFEQPVETLESITLGTLNVLEAIRMLKIRTRLYHAGSSECFGEHDGPLDELTAFRPRSPYAVAKAAAHFAVANYREAYGLHACTGILFNHESPLRAPRFVTRKVIATACRIASGSKERLVLGDLSIERDWGWAPEYVYAMWQMLQLVEANDYVIATGVASSLQRFVELVFSQLQLDWAHHVDYDERLRRPSDLRRSVGNPVRAAVALPWRAQTLLPSIVSHMIAAERGECWPMEAGQ
jgi:GDPmannose 4,6-dehydratase